MMRRSVCVGWVAILLVAPPHGCGSLVMAQAAPATNRLEPFSFLAGSCWEGAFPRGNATDEHCFEWLHDGRFLRDRHVVRGAARPYSGETTYVWDAKSGRVVYWYIASDGSFSTGSAEPRGGSIVFPETHVSAQGTRELLNIWTRTGPNAYTVRVVETTASGQKELWSMEMRRMGMLPDLSADRSDWLSYNRAVTIRSDPSGATVRMDARADAGLYWSPSLHFQRGVIEFEVKGQNVFQRSFVGIAFHIRDSITYEAVYLRPFNFAASDSASRAHAIQYVSHPEWTWRRLRNERQGEFEAAVTPPPDPNAWVHVRLEVDSQRVRAFVNRSAVPSLSISPPQRLSGGGIGFFVHDQSGGEFRNLRVSPAVGPPGREMP